MINETKPKKMGRPLGKTSVKKPNKFTIEHDEDGYFVSVQLKTKAGQKTCYIDLADYEAGPFSKQKISFETSTGYAVLTLHEKKLRVHRVLLNPPADKQTDHINGDKLDNRRKNLRIVTPRENCQNRLKHRLGRCVGTYQLANGTWSSSITLDRKRYWLGVYPTEEAGSAAYFSALKLYEAGVSPEEIHRSFVCNSNV